MDGSFGRGIGEMIVGFIVVVALVSFASGALLAYGLPWLWLLIGQHVSFH